MYKAKCGYEDIKEDSPELTEITCIIVGCKNCQFYKEGQEIYYEQDIKKGIGLWAKNCLNNKKDEIDNQ